MAHNVNIKSVAGYGFLRHNSQLIKVSKSDEEINEIKSFDGHHIHLYILLDCVQFIQSIIRKRAKIIIIVLAAAAAVLVENRLSSSVNPLVGLHNQPVPSV